MAVSYLLNPWESGEYTVRIRDKETDAAALDVTTAGRACDGFEIAIVASDGYPRVSGGFAVEN